MEPDSLAGTAIDAPDPGHGLRPGDDLSGGIGRKRNPDRPVLSSFTGEAGHFTGESCCPYRLLSPFGRVSRP